VSKLINVLIISTFLALTVGIYLYHKVQSKREAELQICSDTKLTQYIEIEKKYWANAENPYRDPCGDNGNPKVCATLRTLMLQECVIEMDKR
jgi:hypothetical protein